MAAALMTAFAAMIVFQNDLTLQVLTLALSGAMLFLALITGVTGTTIDQAVATDFIYGIALMTFLGGIASFAIAAFGRPPQSGRKALRPGT